MSPPEASSSPSAAALHQLRQAVAGLLYPSESDYPFQVNLWRQAAIDPSHPQSLLHHEQQDPQSPVETIGLQPFLNPVMQEQDWFGDSERSRARRFRSLCELLESQLSEITVYRVGSVEMTVYIVGKVKQCPQDAIVLSTKVVET